MRKTILKIMVLLISILFAALPTQTLFAQEPVVQAVMFWMDGCPHCHEVLENILPPLERQYGDQLDIRLIEVVTQSDVDYLYEVASAYGIPASSVGVPLLIVGDEILIGSDQIPQRLPGLIDRYLTQGGVDFPTLPGLRPGQVSGVPFVIEDAAPPVQPTSESPSSTGSPTGENVPAAPQRPGFGLAIVIMVGMVAALIYSLMALFLGIQRNGLAEIPRWQKMAFPLLALAGLAVAGYLAYVEMEATSAVCGPVGDCNAVQSSPYARLFGIPIGVLGVSGYLAILGIWLWGRFSTHSFMQQMPLWLFGITLVGVLFSLYLTYLEPFVIGAVCTWCLSSAAIMTLLMLLNVEPAVQALNRSLESDS